MHMKGRPFSRASLTPLGGIWQYKQVQTREKLQGERNLGQ
jgi:hypothetical protein